MPQKRMELSATQVAASALAAVSGAVLASELGVYGTVLGAAVVSVGATIGSAVFQHVFRRTGEQLRSAVDRGPRNDPRPVPVAATELSSDWNEPRVVRARRRWTWKSYTAVSALVFVLAMVPVVAVELVAGKPMHDITTGQEGSGTSLNPGRQSTQKDQPPGGGPTDPANLPSTAPSTSPSGGPSPSPGAGTSPGTSPGASPSPSPGGSPSGGASTPAAPSGSPSGASTAGATGQADVGGSGDAAGPSGSPSP